MHRPLATAAPRRGRRGIILLVVLALLTLFAVVGLSFVFYAGAEADAARLNREAEARGDDAFPEAYNTQAVNDALSRIIFDVGDRAPVVNPLFETPTDLLTATRGHALASTYANRRVGASEPYTGFGTFHEAFSPPQLPPTVQIDRAHWINYNAFLSLGPAGNQVTFATDPEWTGFRNSAAAPNGQGPNFMTFAPGSPPPGSTTTQTAYIPKNAPYTYPDLNNLYLASISPTSGDVLVPSFHRSWLFNAGNPNVQFRLAPWNPNDTNPVSLTAANTDWISPEGKTRVLRVRPVDQLTAAEINSALGGSFFAVPLDPANNLNAAQKNALFGLIAARIDSGDIVGYPPPNPPDANGNVSFTGDVQNLWGSVGQQRPDSMLLDLGLPIRQYNGRFVKPLAAILITDLESLLNANAHQNTVNGGNHGSHGGFGPWEMNVDRVLPPGNGSSIVTARLASGSNRGANGNQSLPLDKSGVRLPKYSLVNWDASGTWPGATTGSNPVFGLPAFPPPAPPLYVSAQPFTTSPYYDVVDPNPAIVPGTFWDDNGFIVNPGNPVPPPSPPNQPPSRLKATNHPGLFNVNDWAAFPAGGGTRTFPHSDSKRFGVRYGSNPEWYAQTELFRAGAAASLFPTTPPTSPLYRLDPSHPLRGLVGTHGAELDRPKLPGNFNTIQGGSTPTSTLALNSGVYPAQPMFTPGNFPGTFPAAASGANLSDFTLVGGSTNTSVFTHRRQLGPVDLNRPLADYRDLSSPPNVQIIMGNPVPTPQPLSPNNIANAALAWTDRQNLARDIFIRMVVATGAVAFVDPSNGNVTLPQPVVPATTPPTFVLTLPSPPSPAAPNPPITIPVTAAEYNALRYLAQLAANMVDTIDKDDVSTPFVWNPVNATSSPLLFQMDVTAFTTPTTGVAALSMTDPVNRVVFGTEKSRLVINEAYGELTNDPAEPAFTPNMPAQNNFKVRFWVELMNPTSTPYTAYPATAAPGPLGDGSVALVNPAAGVNPYRLVIVPENGTVSTALRDPTNVTGFPLPPGSQLPINFDFTRAAGNQQVVYPANGAWAASPQAPNGVNGFVLVGAQTYPTPHISNGTQVEFDPTSGGMPAAPYNQMIVGTGSAPGSTTAMEYDLGQKPSAATLEANNAANPLRSLRRHVVLLRRLANPYLPANPAIDGQPLNPALAPNPFVTVDYMDWVPAHDAVTRGGMAGMDTADRTAKGGAGQPGFDPADNSVPAIRRYSVGRVQPYAGFASGNPNPGGAGVPTSLPTVNAFPQSCVIAQNPANPPPNGQPKHTFFQNNGRNNVPPPGPVPTYNPGPPYALIGGETIMAPFDWMVHFDRPLVNQLELLHLQAGKPYEVAQLTYAPPLPGGQVRPGFGFVQWLGVDPATGLPGNGGGTASNNGLYRALEVLRVKPWGHGVGVGGRVHGRMNINTIQDPRLLMALLDPQPGNGFGANNVFDFANPGNPNTLWKRAINDPNPIPGVPYRTFNTRFVTLADQVTQVPVPVPGPTIDDDPGGVFVPPGGRQDRPFRAYGSSEFAPDPNSPQTAFVARPGSGIQDTLLRTFQPGLPMGYPAAAGVPVLSLAGVTATADPYLQAEALRKMHNSVTTTSNAFAVTVTLVYLEVRQDPAGNPITVTDGGGAVQRPLLGREAYREVPGDLRRQYFAVVDRSNLALRPGTNLLQPQPFHGEVARVVNPAPHSPPSPLPPAGFVDNPISTMNIYLTNAVVTPGAGPQPYTTAFNPFRLTVFADGQPVTLGSGSVIVVGTGANQDQFTVDHVNEDGSLNVPVNPAAWTPGTNYFVGQRVCNPAAGTPGATVYQCRISGTSGIPPGPTGTGAGIADGSVVWDFFGSPAGVKEHVAGECVSNAVPGNPGPQPTFDRVTNPNSGYQRVVPYFGRVR